MDKKGRPDSNWESVFEKISLHPTWKRNQKCQNKKSLRKINFRNSLFSLLVTKMYLQPVFPTFILRVDKIFDKFNDKTKCGILKNVFLTTKANSFVVIVLTSLIFIFFLSIPLPKSINIVSFSTLIILWSCHSSQIRPPQVPLDPFRSPLTPSVPINPLRSSLFDSLVPLESHSSHIRVPFSSPIRVPFEFHSSPIRVSFEFHSSPIWVPFESHSSPVQVPFE